MTKKRVTVRARVRVTLDITVDSWSGDCAMSQVTKQAQDGAEGAVRQMLHDRRDVAFVGIEHVEVIAREEPCR